MIHTNVLIFANMVEYKLYDKGYWSYGQNIRGITPTTLKGAIMPVDGRDISSFEFGKVGINYLKIYCKDDYDTNHIIEYNNKYYTVEAKRTYNEADLYIYYIRELIMSEQDFYGGDVNQFINDGDSL
jgi:hypothetical protein